MATTTQPTGYWSNGVYYHNNDAYVSALQAEIARQNGGNTLEAATIYAWLAHEGQSSANATDNNVLNIPATSDYNINGVPQMAKRAVGKKGVNWDFGTPQAGIEATATFLLNVKWYKDVRATMAPAGKGDAVAQAAALSASPWSASGYTTLAVDVKKLVLKGYTVGNPATLPLADAATSGTTAQNIASFLGKATGDNLSNDDVTKLAEALWKKTGPPFDPSGVVHGSFVSGIQNILSPYVGHPISAIPDSLNSYFTGIGATPAALVGGVTGVLPDLSGLVKVLQFIADPQNWAAVLSLLIGIPMAMIGALKLAH